MTVYRIKERVVKANGNSRQHENFYLVQTHGWLWKSTGEVYPDTGAEMLVSIADQRRADWMRSELEKVT